MSENASKNPAPTIKRRQRIEEYLLTHAEATNATVAAYFGVSERTISRVRSDGIKKGLLQPSYYDHQTEAPEVTTEGAEVIVKELEKMRGLHNEPLTQEEKLSMLAGSARKAAANNNLSLLRDAILAHDKIEARSTTEKLGPGPPLTEEDLIVRTADILDVVGPALTVAAIGRQLPDFLPTFEEELSRLKATHPQVATEGSIQPADSSSPPRGVAQLVEQRPDTPEIVGSTPTSTTIPKEPDEHPSSAESER